jgi:hypothetical protein
VDRTHVNGVEVIAVEPARGIIIPGQPEALISTVEKVILADETEWFRCIMEPDACVYTNDNFKSVLSHQRTHSAKTKATQLQRTLEKQQAERDAQHARRSNGVQAGVDARKKRHAAEVTSKDKRIANIQRGLSDMAFALEKIHATLPPLTEGIRALNAELGALEATAATDPELIEKANKYDALKGILGN